MTITQMETQLFSLIINEEKLEHYNYDTKEIRLAAKLWSKFSKLEWELVPKSDKYVLGEIWLQLARLAIGET